MLVDSRADDKAGESDRTIKGTGTKSDSLGADNEYIRARAEEIVREEIIYAL